MSAKRSGPLRRAVSSRGAPPQRRALPPEQLMAEADRARASAYAPYSHFRVGAALITAAGRVIHGCNVENASYGLSMCAERNAVFKAVSEGERDFVAVAVSAGPGRAAPPCGACRQVLQEFAPKIRVYWRDERGRLVGQPLARLLAMPFDPSALEK